MSAPEVLIVGAGPTGLVLGLSLLRRGVPFRIIDEDDGPGLQSRAIVVQARTLELYDQLGLADGAIERGIVMRDVRLLEGGREVARFSLGDLGEGLSPYPFALILPQDDHERFLVEQLSAAGVEVDWGVKLERFTERGGLVSVTTMRKRRQETADVGWLVGCDGARSRVRKGLALDFPGGTYEQPFYVADVSVAGGFRTDLAVSLGAGGLALMFPVRSSGMQRLIGLAPERAENAPPLTFEDVRASAESMLGVAVETVNWFSAYRVHHRVAARFRVGRVMIAGDAGHIHSPAGGQGMNTDIGDAVNLGWKLAEVVQGRAPETLLDSYERERLAFARQLVSTTDRAFRGFIDDGARGRLLRRWIAPQLAPRLLRMGAARRAAFRTLSQIGVSYRDSGDGEGRAGQIHAGDRLPWIATGNGNFEALRTAHWQVHIHGQPSGSVRRAATELGLPLVERPWDAGAERAGFTRDALYLVRPDGYLALVSADADAGVLRRFVGRHRSAREVADG